MSYLADAAGVTPIIIPEMSREISPKDLLTVWKLYRLMVRERPDLVHTHTAKAGTLGRVAGFMYRWMTPSTLVGRPRRCRFVHTYHGHVFHSYYSPAKTRLFLTIEKLLARMATDRIIVITEQQRREISEQFKVGGANQFAVIPLGIDLSVYEQFETRRMRARQELNAGEDQVLIGIVGRLTEIKNHRLFLEAAALLKKLTDAKVRFLIIGDGGLRTDLESQVRALGLENDVEFLRTRNDPENFYSALDVVALTSLNEGTPLSLIEAMANARPVVATAVGGVVDLVGSNVPGNSDPNYQVCERGFAVKSGDAQGFSQALERLVRDRGLREELGARGRAFVIQNYAKERLFEDMNSLYSQLLNAASGPISEAAAAAQSTSQRDYRARLTPRP